jgi:hypothetical protein
VLTRVAGAPTVLIGHPAAGSRESDVPLGPR